MAGKAKAIKKKGRVTKSRASSAVQAPTKLLLAKLEKPALRVISEAIRTLDPKEEFVKLDVDAQTIQYSPAFVQHETIATYQGEEEVARAYIVSWLCTVGGYLPANIELEKRYSIGRPKEGAELDILVKRPTGESFALIEVKAPDEFYVEQDKYIEGQLFNIAPHEPECKVLSFATVTTSGDTAHIEAISIDYTQFSTFEKWRLSRAAANQIPANYGEPVHVHFAKGSAKDLNRNQPVDHFRKLRKRLHDILWKGSTPDNVIYTYVVKLFLAKIYDEKTTAADTRYRFQIFYSGSQRESIDETFTRIAALYQDAYKRYLSGDGTIAEPFNTREFSKEQIAFVVELMQDVSMTSSDAHNADVLGAFFEGITRDGFKQSKGLFFTHLNIVSFILDVLNIEGLVTKKIQSSRDYRNRLPYIIDPACGSGTFLLAAMQAITTHVRKNKKELSKNDDTRDFLTANFPTGQENLWAKDFLYGIDQSDLLSMSTKVNMVLRRDGNTHVFHADGLSSLSKYGDQFLRGLPHEDTSCYSKHVTNSFDVVISNPPFSITLDPATQGQLESTFELAKERNSENLFLERWYQLLKPKGRLGVVLPESFVSTKENLNARLFLFAHFNIKAIVALPRHAFEPWTPTRTSLLFADKKTVIEEQEWKDAAVAAEQRARDHVNKTKRSISAIRKAIGFIADASVHAAADTIVHGLKDLGMTAESPEFGFALSLQEVGRSLSLLLKNASEHKIVKTALCRNLKD
jgi:type I restriction enzyme M protein